MGEVFFPLFLIMGVGIAVAIVMLAHVSDRRRQEGFQLAAARLGLAFTSEDPFGLLDLPFELFTRGDGRGVENILYGTWQGMAVQVFDYWYYEETSNGKTTSRTTSRFSCVVTPIDARCPHLTIAPENLLTRLADALALDDLQFESEAFNRAFNVKGDHELGVALCDARMMTWLLANGADRVFEVHGDRMLLAGHRLAPHALGSLLETVRDWAEQVPRAVFSLYAK
jgi:hypothetical protein